MHQFSKTIQIMMDGLPTIAESLVKALVESPLIALFVFTMLAVIVLPFICKYVMRKCFPEDYIIDEGSIHDDVTESFAGSDVEDEHDSDSD